MFCVLVIMRTCFQASSDMEATLTCSLRYSVPDLSDIIVGLNLMDKIKGANVSIMLSVTVAISARHQAFRTTGTKVNFDVFVWSFMLNVNFMVLVLIQRANLRFIEDKTGVRLSTEPVWSGVQDGITFTIKHQKVAGIREAQFFLHRILDKARVLDSFSDWAQFLHFETASRAQITCQ